MSNQKKLNIGPLPKQVEDYSHYEETEVLWGRLAFVALLVVACIASTTYFVAALFSDDESVSVKVSPVVQSIEQTRTLPEEPLPLPEPVYKDARAEESLSVAQVKTAENNLVSTETQAENKSAVEPNAPDVEQSSSRLSDSVISPIYTAHSGIASADLRIGYDDGELSEPLGYDVSMSKDGLIKVVLGTQMEGLKGQTLYHEWYLNDKRMARVKIPVRKSSQGSHSSKFINHQMLGAWKVKIVDETKELYAEANFTVE